MKPVFALGIGLLFLSQAAFAKPEVMTVPVPPELIAWVEARTGAQLPKQQLIHVVENDDELFGGYDALHASGDAAFWQGAIYFPIRTVVHLQEVRSQALVVHELIHEAQALSGRSFVCTGQREAEAYAYQNKYLAEHSQILIHTATEIAAMNACDGEF